MIQASKLAQAQGFVTKSEDASVLLNAVDALLRGENLIPETTIASRIGTLGRVFLIRSTAEKRSRGMLGQLGSVEKNRGRLGVTASPSFRLSREARTSRSSYSEGVRFYPHRLL